MADLFGASKQNISYHLQNIYSERELNKSATVKEILTVQKEGKRKVKRNIEYYNLDAIISTGYRINSERATQFRIWATKVLNELYDAAVSQIRDKCDGQRECYAGSGRVWL